MFRSVFALVLLVVGASCSAQAQPNVDRGAYLVNSIMACDGCHTQNSPAGLNMQKRFAGGSQLWDEAAYTVRGSNITPDPATGIGAWTAGDLKKLMTDGVRPNGTPVAPQMPYAFYKILTVGDLDAVVAYIQTAAPIANKVQDPVYKQPTQATLIPGGETRFTDDDLKDKLKRGFYLATIAHCMECHARDATGRPDFKARWGKGGHEMTGPFGKVTVSNITSHPTKGIGSWTDAEVKTALTKGVSRDGRVFKLPMARQVYFSKLTGDDLDALVAWVRTIPPLE